MGYTTTFEGHFTLDKEPSIYTVNTLEKWLDLDETAPIKGYCQWVLDGKILKWDGCEKFYCYIEWLKEIIKLLEDEDIKLNGTVYWSGESQGDTGTIVVEDNSISQDHKSNNHA